MITDVRNNTACIMRLQLMTIAQYPAPHQPQKYLNARAERHARLDLCGQATAERNGFLLATNKFTVIGVECLTNTTRREGAAGSSYYYSCAIHSGNG